MIYIHPFFAFLVNNMAEERLYHYIVWYAACRRLMAVRRPENSCMYTHTWHKQSQRPCVWEVCLPLTNSCDCWLVWPLYLLCGSFLSGQLELFPALLSGYFLNLLCVFFYFFLFLLCCSQIQEPRHFVLWFLLDRRIRFQIARTFFFFLQCRLILVCFKLVTLCLDSTYDHNLGLCIELQL